MPVIMPVHLLTLSKCKTPDEFRDRAWELLTPAVEKYKPCGTDVLFVTYIEPEQSGGGILKPQKSQQEILFQGNVGLVLKLGPLVNKYDSRGMAWEGDKISVNDWIVCRFADCWEIHLDGVSCRLIDPESIKGIVTDPAIVTHRPASVSQMRSHQTVLQGSTALTVGGAHG